MELNKQLFVLPKLRQLSLLVTFSATCLIMLISTGSYGQTWDEIFKQKKTQIKYLGQQIAALQVYTGYLKKGYEIAGSGINTIKDFKNGEFSLHQSFITSLKTVNPGIKNSSRVIDIIALQLSINKQFSSIRNNDHQSYVQDVKKKVNEECTKDLDELLLVITSGKIEMSDDERIIRLNKVYESMRDKFSFTQFFCNEVRELNVQKSARKSELIIESKLNGISL